MNVAVAVGQAPGAPTGRVTLAVRASARYPLSDDEFICGIRANYPSEISAAVN
jgi:hypothetical protein